MQQVKVSDHTLKILETRLKRLNTGWVSLIQAPVEMSTQINIEMIKLLQSFGFEGIYITLSKEYTELIKIFRKQNVDLNRLAFVDGVSQLYGIGAVDAPGVRYISGPISLDGIVACITDIVPSMESSKKFVFLDSITTILLYNSLERTIKFSEYFVKSLRMLDVSGVMVSVSKGFANNNLIKELTKLSDEVINL